MVKPKQGLLCVTCKAQPGDHNIRQAYILVAGKEYRQHSFKLGE